MLTALAQPTCVLRGGSIPAAHTAGCESRAPREGRRRPRSSYSSEDPRISGCLPRARRLSSKPVNERERKMIWGARWEVESLKLSSHQIGGGGAGGNRCMRASTPGCRRQLMASHSRRAAVTRRSMDSKFKFRLFSFVSGSRTPNIFCMAAITRGQSPSERAAGRHARCQARKSATPGGSYNVGTPNSMRGYVAAFRSGSKAAQ